MNPWTSKLSFLGRGAWAILIATVAGAAIAFLLVPTFPSADEGEAHGPQVRLLDQPLALDDRAVSVAMERVRRFASAQFHLKLPDGKTRELALGRLGAQIDKQRLTILVREARDPNSLLRRHHSMSQKSGPLQLPVPLVLDPKDSLRELLRVKDETDKLPSDARMNLETRALTPEIQGQLLDVDRTFLAIERALVRGERSAQAHFDVLKPKRVAQELGNVRFSHVLGFFETHYDRSDRSRDRTYNLRLAASKLDGQVLLPGDVFDFNEVVGPRDEANGYRVATVIAEGELVDGLGGGTCQVSGTLHGAVFFAGLEVVERVPHTRPSSYIKMGLDATVVYPTINFRFKNQFDFPVVLHETVKNGIVRAEILGPERHHTVTLIRRITDVTPYEQVEREDDRLPRGVRVLSQRGVAGFAVNRYRIVRDGPHAVREKWSDKYPPTPQIVRVGTLDMPKDSVEVEDDRHPEYLADELLVITVSSDTEGASGDAEGLENADPTYDGSAPDDVKRGATDSVRKTATDSPTVPPRAEPSRAKDERSRVSEWRQAGKTGVAGWTKEQKMPQWEPSGKQNADMPKSGGNRAKRGTAGAKSGRTTRATGG